MTDVYPGQDLLADVFPGTEDAPTPLVARDCAGGVRSLWANPADPRWHVVAELWPDGEIQFVSSVKPRGPESAQDDQGSGHMCQALLSALRRNENARNGNGEPR